MLLLSSFTVQLAASFSFIGTWGFSTTRGKLSVHEKPTIKKAPELFANTAPWHILTARAKFQWFCSLQRYLQNSISR
jgi:hypothetical protein